MSRAVRWAVALVVVALAGSGFTLAAPPARADDTTVSVDAGRSGWDPNEAALSPSNVSAADFGQLFSTQLDGQIYAEPVEADGMIIAVTENDNVYGLDESTGAIRWQRNVGKAWTPPSNCGDLVPTIGITATPVIDPATETAYFTAKVDDGPDLAHPHWYLHAVDITTGAERPGFPTTLGGTPTNNAKNTFTAATAMQRPGLLLMNGVVYAGFASHCDLGKYVGYVLGVNATSGVQTTLWATESYSSSAKAGIWQSGGGLMSDGPGRIFFATGNGVSPAPTPGDTPPATLAESVVRLDVQPDGSLKAGSFFSPVDNTSLDNDDTDLGSGGPAALPDSFGTASHPHLLVQDGKDGRVFLLDRDHLGGTGQGPGGTDAAVQVTQQANGVWGHPAVWPGDGGYVYYVENHGPLRAYKAGVDSTGTPLLTSVGTSAGTFGYTSGSPVVTSDGTASNTALVWVVYSSGPTGTNAQLRAYDAVPVNGVLTLRYAAPLPTVSKFEVVSSDQGRLFVGTRTGALLAYGRPTAASLSSPPTNFGSVAAGSSATRTVTVTATRPVTVTAVSATAPYSVGSVTLPATLAAGGTLGVPVSFAPTSPGAQSGTLTFTTDSAPVSFDLEGTGTRPGLGASPTALDFGQVPAGGKVTQSVQITNTGAATETIQGTTAPAAPFSATGLPAAGTTLAPSASVSIPVTFAPGSAVTSTGSLSVTSDAGSVSIPLTGTGVSGSSHLSITPTTVAFGSLQVGQTLTRTFTVTNTGNLVLTITKAAPPNGVFNVPNPIPEGQKIEPGDSLSVGVTFTPAAVGPATAQYTITGDDGQGAQLVTFTGTGIAAGNGSTLPAPTASSWRLNGSAATSGTDTVLTTATKSQSGDAVYTVPVSPEGLHAHFTAQIGGGTGGDGLTFALLDASKASTASTGHTGSALGFGGLPGVAVTLDTYKNGSAEPSNNFVGVATGTPALTYLATATVPAKLRSGTHDVDIVFLDGRVQVSVDDTPTLDVPVTLPGSALLAFTGSTGGATDVHTVRNVVITTPATTPDPTAAGWSRNGSTTVSGTDLVLTPDTTGQKGTAFATQTLPTAHGLHATFTSVISGGASGADGETFALIDATAAQPTAIGGAGSGIGFGGLPGVAVTLDTYRNTGEPSNNFVGLATSTQGGRLTYVATSTSVPPLRTGTHVVDVLVVGNRVRVSVDGTQVIDSSAATVPPSVYAGFTASTGAVTDSHAVRAVSITAAT